MTTQKIRTPKTLNLIGEEAKTLRDDHKDIESKLELASMAVETFTERAQRADSFLRGFDRGRRRNAYGELPPKRSNDELWEKVRDESVAHLGRSVLEQGDLKEQSFLNLKNSSQHYQQHAAQYHEIAVTEAAQDGVHITVKVQNSPAQHIDVQVG